MRGLGIVGGLAVLLVVALVALLRPGNVREPRRGSSSGVEREDDVALVASNNAERRTLDATPSIEGTLVSTRRKLDDLAPFGAELALCCETEDARPVPGAELWIADPKREAWRLAELADDAARWVEERGTRMLADERGVAFVARPRSSFALLARAKGLEALVELDPSAASPLHVVMRAAAALTVVVREENGAPLADIGVRVLRADRGQALWRGRTDAQGRARVATLGDADVSVPLRVVADVVMRDAPLAWWLRAAGAERTIELVVAHPRRLELVFVDAARRPISFDALAYVALERSGPQVPFDESLLRELEVAIERGRARIDCAEALEELELELYGRDGDWTFELPPPGAGPTRIELAFEPEERVPVTVELRDEAGAAVCAARLTLFEQVELEPGQWKNSDSSNASSDELGHFTFLRRVRGEPESTAAQRLVVYEAHACPPRWATMACGREIDAPEAPLRGVMRPLPTAMAGHVRDTEGHPIAGARVRFEFPDEDRRPWFERALDAALTDAEGRFVVHGPPAVARARAQLERSDESISIESGGGALDWGALDLDLRVEAYGSVDLTLAGLRDASSVELTLMNDENSCSIFESWRDGDDVHARMLDVPAGRYTFAVFAAGTLQSLAEVQGVLVRAGETTRDPRLLPVVLPSGSWPQPRVAPSEVVLRIVDAQGNPIEHGWFTSVGSHPDRAWAWACGEVHLGGERSEGRLAVWAAGCDRVIDAWPRTSTTWTLPPLTPLRLAPGIPASWKDAGLRFSATVRPWADRVTQVFVSGSLTQEIGAGAELEFALPSGTYRVILEAQWRSTAGLQTLQLSVGDIEHLGAEHPQPWTFDGERERWEVALRAQGAPLDRERR